MTVWRFEVFLFVEAHGDSLFIWGASTWIDLIICMECDL